MHGSLFSEYRFTAIDSDINSLFGRRLRFLREANGFQRDDFALRIDVSSFELDELEAGRMEADLVMLHVVSLALCLPLPELLRGL